MVVVGVGPGNGAARRGPGARPGFCGAVFDAAAQRPHAARSFALDGRALASRCPTGAAADPGALGTGACDDGDHSRREGAEGGHRAFPLGAGSRGGGPGGGGELVSACPVPINRRCFTSALLSLCRHPRAAQEPGGADRSMARPATSPSGGFGASGPEAGGRSRRFARRPDCDWRARSPIANCPRFTPARWPSSIRRCTKASAFPCWKRCSAALP